MPRSHEQLIEAMRRARGTSGRSISPALAAKILREMIEHGTVVEVEGGYELAPQVAAEHGAALSYLDELSDDGSRPARQAVAA